MCTIAAKQLYSSWFLIKTRDPVPWMRLDDEIKLFDSSADKFKKLIIQNPNPKEDGYYGGINEKGVAFVATFLPVAENQVSYIRRPYVRLILEAASAKRRSKLLNRLTLELAATFLWPIRTKLMKLSLLLRRSLLKGSISQPPRRTTFYTCL